jgi:hypothetical protein
VPQVSRTNGVAPRRCDVRVGFHECCIGITQLRMDGIVDSVQYGPVREVFQEGPVLHTRKEAMSSLTRQWHG